MKIIYDNEIDGSGVSLSAQSEDDTKPVENIQHTSTTKVFRSDDIENEISYGDCESSSPTLDGGYAGLSNATWARSGVQQYAGSYSWLLTKTSAAAGGDAEVYLNDNHTATDDMHGIEAGKEYTLSVFMYSDVATLASAKVIFQEYYGAAWHDSIELNPGSVSTWVNDNEEITINSSTTGVRLKLEIDTAEDSGKVLYIDSFYFYVTPSIVIDFGSAISCDALAIIAHNFSSGIRCKLQGNSSDSWSAPAIEETITYNSKTMVNFFTADSYQYWRIVFDDFDNTDGYVQIGRVFLGTALTVSSSAGYNFPINFDDTDDFFKSETGNIFGRPGVKLKGYSFTFPNWDQAMVNSFDTMWEAIGRIQPFVLSIEDNTITNFPVLYCNFISKPQAEYIFEDFYTARFEVEECK